MNFEISKSELMITFSVLCNVFRPTKSEVKAQEMLNLSARRQIKGNFIG